MIKHPDIIIVQINRSFGITIAPNFWYCNTKECGIEAWLETNVGRLNYEWCHIFGVVTRIGIYNAQDAAAFKLKFG